MYATSHSQEIYDRLCQVIPGGVNSPVRSCKNLLPQPVVAESGACDMLYDVDGNGYIDYCGSWGALIHGHAHPRILEAVSRRMLKGTTFGLTTEIEEKLARKVCELVPSVEKIRFVSSGTEATMSATRLARGYTNREIVVKFTGNYHGHADFFLVNAGSGVFHLNATSSSAGIPQAIVQHTVSLPYNDLSAFSDFMREHGASTAAVILEPVAGNMGLVAATKEFIALLRQETERCGALLIFDEVMNGFRLSLQGAQGLYEEKPDLTCFGKIVGGGFPAAAFGGRAAIMDHLAPLGSVYQAGTLSGNPLAMEAGLQALLMLERDGFYEELQDKADIITKPIREYLLANDVNACLQQEGSMFSIFFGKRKVSNMDDVRETDREQFAEFFRFLLDNGVYIPPSSVESWFVSMAHTTSNLEKTRDLILEFLYRM